MEALAYVILAIVVLIGALCLAFAIYIRTIHYLLTYRAVRQMRQTGRFLSKSEFEQRVEASAGTVIFEYPTLGWRVLRIWWTPDDVLSLAQSAGISDRSPDSQGHDPSPLEAWIHDNFWEIPPFPLSVHALGVCPIRGCVLLP
jgi:hypothetical protein